MSEDKIVEKKYKYFCFKIFRKIDYCVNNCKAQIWNRRKYYKIQITHFSKINDEIN